MKQTSPKPDLSSVDSMDLITELRRRRILSILEAHKITPLHVCEALGNEQVSQRSHKVCGKNILEKLEENKKFLTYWKRTAGGYQGTVRLEILDIDALIEKGIEESS